MSRNRRPHLPPRSGAEEAKGLELERSRLGTIDLFFTDPKHLEHIATPIWQDVSTLAVAGRSIFCSCDETATVERVLCDARSGKADRHESLALGEIFDLPGGTRGEMDIEGLAIADGYLWICGSHALKRDDPDANGLAGLRGLDWDLNRGFLGRVPLVERGRGVFELASSTEDGSGRRAAMVRMKSTPKTPLRKLLARDPLIGEFVVLPGKENGLDIEGLAARGDTVLLGLRGPVVGGLALIVRLEMKLTGSGHLKPRKLAGGARHALQALDLNGQAIRDLLWHGDRLLILSGATTDLEALQSVFAIEDYDPERALYPVEALRRVLDLPIRRGSDHAEGLALIEVGGAPRLLVAYDAPSADRVDPEAHRLSLDIFELGGRAVS